MFAGKTGVDEYTVEWGDIIRVDRTTDRREDQRRAMQIYAGLLEDFARRYPYQVYLFEDAWRTSN
jgi:predicted LPLAT superfamily acyltransferase